MQQPDEIEAKIRQVLGDVFEVEPELMTPDAKLREDLGLDSLDGVDLVVALEKTFRCRISEEDARSIRTVRDICDRVRTHIGAAAAAATPKR
jgi:acyl carrier protein